MISRITLLDEIASNIKQDISSAVTGPPQGALNALFTYVISYKCGRYFREDPTCQNITAIEVSAAYPPWLYQYDFYDGMTDAALVNACINELGMRLKWPCLPGYKK
ncbi:MAG: hypothetical protein ACJAUL_000745 [Paraglaciecola sp.]|jgi:hypothetical protein